jgi:transposase
MLSLVPDPEQRLWRTWTRSQQPLMRERVRLHSQWESWLEDAKIQLATVVSDLLGVSSRRMLEALADGETDPAAWASMAEPELRATPAQSADVLKAAVTVTGLHRKVLRLFLDRVDLIERQMQMLRESIASAMQAHEQAIMRLAAVPGFGVDSAQQVIAEVGPQAATFGSTARLASWVEVCPGREESAEVSKSNRTPKGNRAMRRILSQAAHAAIKAKGSIFPSLYRRLVPRMGS